MEEEKETNAFKHEWKANWNPNIGTKFVACSASSVAGSSVCESVARGLIELKKPQ